MVAAVEKQKFVYVLNRDSAANLTISSPLEAHKTSNIVFSICALDTGFDNPVFAAIELDYGDADQASPRGLAEQLPIPLLSDIQHPNRIAKAIPPPQEL